MKRPEYLKRLWISLGTTLGVGVVAFTLVSPALSIAGN